MPESFLFEIVNTKMRSMNWKNIAEFIGIVAIVASLLFVGLQLQQDRQLVRAELGSDANEFMALVDLGMSDPEVGRVWAKMLDSPQDLSVAEMVQVNGILRSVHVMMIRECYLMIMGVFSECRTLSRVVANNYFSNKYAQTWWKHSHKPDDYYSDIISGIITSLDASANRSLHEDVKADL
jgi:hypothetical protein